MGKGFETFIVKRYIILVVLAIVTAAVSILVQVKPELKLLPLANSIRDSLYEVSTFDDAADNGTSEVTPPNVTEKSIQYAYAIHNTTEYPYAGLSMFCKPSDTGKIKSHMNFTGYTHMQVAGKTNVNRSALVSIKTFVKGLTNEAYPNSRKPSEITLSPVDGVFNQKLAFKDLETPDWWYSANKTTSEKVGATDYSQIMEIVFQNGDDSKVDEKVAVTIEKIVLTKDLTVSIVVALATLAIFIGSISAVRFRKEPIVEEKNEKIIISYDRVEIEDENDTDVNRIIEHIASNYPNPEFSVEQLAKGAGVSTSRIPTLLKKQYSMNFKQYLNTIRITEAKRLLLETEHQIVTIAHSVGYNNIPHFNRTFKQVTGLSPKQYRDNPEQAIDNLPGSTSRLD